MAQHRGSVLGEDPETKFEQPSQKMFDTRLWELARGFDRSRPIFVEGESSDAGACRSQRTRGRACARAR